MILHGKQFCTNIDIVNLSYPADIASVSNSPGGISLIRNEIA